MTADRMAIRLLVTHPDRAAGPIEGFRFLWAYYVNGFRPDRHCQPCLRGRLVREFSTATARSGVEVVLEAMDRYPHVYVCGVGAGKTSERHRTNLHLPLEYEPGASVVRTTYNGYVFSAQNARDVAIPRLPDGWHGLPAAFTRCRNFQFGVARYGAGPIRDAGRP